MSFWDHVEALRMTLFKVIGTLASVAIILFIFMPKLFDNVILAPCDGNFVLYRWLNRIAEFLPGLGSLSSTDFHVNLINIQLASQFYIHMSTSFWLALVLSFPIVVYLLWQFVSPALYENEKRGARTVFAIGNILFFIGIAVGYFIVFPFSLRFFADYHVSELVPNQISLDSYVDTFLSLIFTMGIVFELPLLSLTLSKLGLIRRSFFYRFRRHAICALLILAAIITPSDPFSMVAVFLPLYLLYEASALLVKKDNPKETE
ncbi:MAG: twin-arginine translocase subunit TatC [Muribaculaceae bacterium]